ncbi:MAG: phage tail sheath family protein [Bacteroidia bacterium]|nr:phage tail sheath family protein [Bacteroidia bacterium]
MDVVASELGADADQTSINTDVNNFRVEVGADNLKYGAGYFPPIKTSLNYYYDEALVHLSGTRLGNPITGGTNLAQLMPGNAEKASGSIWVHDNSKVLAGQTITLGSTVLEFDDQITMGATASQSATHIASAINALADFDASAVGSIVYISASETGSNSADKKNYAKLQYSETENPGLTLSGPYLTGGRDQSSSAATGTITISNLTNLTDTGNDTFTVDGTVFKAVVGAPGDGEFTVAGSKLDTATNLMNAINDAGLKAAATSAEMISTNAVITIEAKKQGSEGNTITLVFANGGGSAGGSVSGATLTGGLNTIDSDLYSMVKTELSKQYAILYPSASIAGIYARVDSERGVWKAPANVGVRKSQGLAISLTDALQENLNVDATTGKSINALRTFKGKGTLVWGARTLAGNDNEWRYVPVRRFYNMVEESIKKATEFVVFEPNDAKTWMRVKTMCENFLTRMWQQGALAGAKPADAFFVNVGLGITMTSQDILEGRMNVEIGMAAVRPAEFIILKFSHKLAVS